MITNVIVGLSVAFAVALLLANWLVPALRRQIEQPKYTFQEQLQHFDSQQFDSQHLDSQHLDSQQLDKQRQNAQGKSSDQTNGADKGSSNETR